MDEFRKAIFRIPKNTSYQLPHANARHPFNIFMDIISSFIWSFSNHDSNPIIAAATDTISWELSVIYQTLRDLSNRLELIDFYRKCSRSTAFQRTKNLVMYPENNEAGMAIEGNGIYFEWPHDKISGPALRNISFKFPAGQVIAIVGENG